VARMRRSLTRFFARLGFIQPLGVSCLVALVLCAVSAPAYGEQARKVIVIDPGVPALSGRLVEEIEALGLEAALIVESEPSESLEGSARKHGAIAAIRIGGSGTGAVEMTIVDRATGKTVSRRLAIATPSDPSSAELVATRTVELLRASLMELSAAHPPRGEVSVTEPEIEILTAQEAPSLRLSLAIGPSAVKGSSFGLSFGLGTSISVLWKERIGMTGHLFLPVVGAELETAEGRIELRPSLYRVGGIVFLGERRSVFSGYLESGLLFGVLALSGAAESPYLGVHEDELVWGPWLGAGLRSSLTSKLGLVFGVDVAFTYPKTVIRSAGDEVTTFGRPLVSGMSGLEMTWP
jgi:hypothetical protein